CHGAHEILKHDDPRSSVFPLNVPRTCGRCHGDAALMRGYGLTDNPLADFTAGVHGEALMTRRDASAPECAHCHGAHGAAPPGVGDVDKVCGQCHVSARANFLEGPHKDAMRKAGLPECASCHSNHRILKTDVSMLDTVCSTCHEASSPPVMLGHQMKTLYTGARDEIDKAGRLMEQAAAVPLYMEDYQARLEEARTSLVEVLPAMHALDLARVDRLTHRARSIGSEIESEVHGKLEARKWRRLGLGVFWFYLILTLALLLRQRQRSGTGVA
ncbi:MAG TPA: hypothetical protein VFE84_04760, partial [Patescibacteria group bacterium]|nr:hypothetical protein [Patescibacteria group bacterium]